MRLYLIQHGKAKPKDEDPDRHLTETGVLEVEKMAAILKPLEITVQSVWHSPKTRAAQTAEILSSSLASPQDPIQHDGLAPKDDIQPVIDEITCLNHDIAVVGHLPFLSRLASMLLSGNAENEIIRFQNSGVLCLEKNKSEKWLVCWMITPDFV